MTDKQTDTTTPLPGGREVVMSFRKINLMAIPVAIGACVAALAPYAVIWGFARLGDGMLEFFAPASFLPAVIIGILVHELLHGVTWALAGARPFSSIRFGFNVSTLTPYAHFRDPLPANAYRLGAAMPGLLLGVLPLLVSFITGNGWLLGFGMLFLVAAAGDMLILWMLHDVPSTSLIQDHPSKPGCVVFEGDPSVGNPVR